MSNQSQRKTSQQDEQKQQVNKPDNIIQQIGGEVSSVGLSGGLISSGNDATIQSLAAQLSNSNIPVIQRQVMAGEIGRVAGNQYLQTVMRQVKQIQQPKENGDLSKPSTEPIDPVTQDLFSTPVLTVQRTPINKLDNSIQRQELEQPIVEEAPDSAISIEQFISLVIDEEEKYPKHEQQNTKLMITRLRKIFYDRKGWDEHLIEGAKGVEAPYKTTAEETGRQEVEIPGPLNDFEMVRKTYTVTDKTGKIPEIAQNQEIRLSDGSYMDIGHVFAGLDAENHPQEADTGIPFLTVGIDSNVDAVTWVGDLGSVLAELQIKWISNDRSISYSEGQAIINEYASPQDMLGNIDAYVIASKFTIDSESSGMKVSEILSEYYLGKEPDCETPAQDHRYSLFAQAVGLKDWDGSKFNNEDDWVDKYTDQVNDAAALYIGANAEGSWLGIRGAAVGMSMNAGGQKLVQLFLDALKQHILAEPRD